MNVYDFDKTIYAGDCSIDFYLFCIKKKPVIIKVLPKQIRGFLLYRVGKISKKRFKEIYFSFLGVLDGQADKLVLEFWDGHEKRIKKWYREQKLSDDLIISASPFFLLQEICNRLEIQEPLTTNVDMSNGTFSSENCYGQEKVLRYRARFQDKKIDNFYSDSVSDKPLAIIAENAYLVKGNVVKHWNMD